mmetsp:Transcript_20079/g.52137  ORF Transcript_20079/g.52137 Transcript_20079/m.52137 type:complete len:440 (+) Transcript_20079:176-1495(+)
MEHHKHSGGCGHLNHSFAAGGGSVEWREIPRGGQRDGDASERDRGAVGPPGPGEMVLSPGPAPHLPANGDGDVAGSVRPVRHWVDCGVKVEQNDGCVIGRVDGAVRVRPHTAGIVGRRPNHGWAHQPPPQNARPIVRQGLVRQAVHQPIVDSDKVLPAECRIAIGCLRAHRIQVPEDIGKVGPSKGTREVAGHRLAVVRADLASPNADPRRQQRRQSGVDSGRNLRCEIEFVRGGGYRRVHVDLDVLVMRDGGYGNAKLGSIGNKVAQKVQRHCCSRAVVIVKAVRIRTHDLGACRKVRVHLHQELVKNLKIKSFRLGIVSRVLFISQFKAVECEVPFNGALHHPSGPRRVPPRAVPRTHVQAKDKLSVCIRPKLHQVVKPRFVHAPSSTVLARKISQVVVPGAAKPEDPRHGIAGELPEAVALRCVVRQIPGFPPAVV